MSGINIKTRMGPETYQVAASVTGGQVVIADATDNNLVTPSVGPAANVLGVALNDGEPAGSDVNTHFATHRPDVGVAYSPAVVHCTFVDAVEFGALVTSAADGQVQALGAGTFGQVLGRCVEPGGVAPGAQGLVRLMV